MELRLLTAPQPFVEALEQHINHFDHQGPWGGQNALKFLLDSGESSFASPITSNHARVASGKLGVGVLRGLGGFVAAWKFYDVLAWLKGPSNLKDDVLAHARRGGLIGGWKVRRI